MCYEAIVREESVVWNCQEKSYDLYIVMQILSVGEIV